MSLLIYHLLKIVNENWDNLLKLNQKIAKKSLTGQWGKRYIIY